MKCFLKILRGRFSTFGLLLIGLGISSLIYAKELPSLICEIAESRDFNETEEDETGETVLISCKTRGIPEKTPIILMSTRLDNVSKIYEEKFFIGKNGYINSETDTETPYRIAMCNMFLGEPLVFKIYDRRSFVKK